MLRPKSNTSTVGLVGLVSVGFDSGESLLMNNWAAASHQTKASILDRLGMKVF